MQTSCQLLRRILHQVQSSTRFQLSMARAIEQCKGQDLILNTKKSLIAPSQCGVSAHDRILLCVSGGIDSVAMLHLVYAAKSAYMPGLQLRILHFNHKKREESEEEAVFVSNIAKSYSIPFFICDFKAEGTGERYSGGFQNTARDWRRRECTRLLNEWEEEDKLDKVFSRDTKYWTATAHHKDDQTETFLLKLLRGSHISNLTPMKPRSENFIRPLLFATKQELKEYMESNKYEWREDFSNTERIYKRNVIRLDLIPLMAEIAGGQDALYRRVDALSEQSSDIRNFLNENSVKYYNDYNFRHQNKTSTTSSLFLVPNSFEHRFLVTDLFLTLSPLVQSDLLHGFITKFTGHTPTYAFIRKVLDACRNSDDTNPSLRSRSWDLCDEWVVVKVGAAVKVVERAENLRSQSEAFLRKSVIGNRYVFYMENLHVTKGDDEKSGISSIDTENNSDVVHVTLHNIAPGKSLVIRRSNNGDSFWPPWKGGVSKLVDMMRHRKVPLFDRSDVVVIAYGDSESMEEDGNTESSGIGTELLAVLPVVSTRHSKPKQGICNEATVTSITLCIGIAANHSKEKRKLHSEVENDFI